MGNSTETFQISLDAAEVYESKFVPAIFGECAPHPVGFAEIGPGQAVLDVACGTGIVARRGPGAGEPRGEHRVRAVHRGRRPARRARSGEPAQCVLRARQPRRPRRPLAAAGLEVTATRTRLGAARFASIDEFVTTEVEASPLIERLDDTTYRRIRDDAQDALQPFVTTTGIEVSLEWHLVAAKKQ